MDFIDVSEPCLCNTNFLISDSSKTRTGAKEVMLVQRLEQTAIFRTPCDCKFFRHTSRGCRYYTL